MTTDARTSSFYDAEAVAYATRAKTSPFLADFIASLPHHADVLDLGCGGGQDSAALRNAGCRVTSLDASIGLAAEAKRKWDVEVMIGDFAALAFNKQFDGIWASASLHHAQREDLPAVFAGIRRALRPGGALYASLKAGDEDRRDRFDRCFCAMNEDALAALVVDWSDVRIERHHGAGYDGEATSWLRLRARR